MKKLFLVSLLFMLGTLASGQTTLPPCDPNNVPPNCTDYFGVANWANSPLPAGAIAGFTVVSAGSGYATPIVTITDTTGTGAGIPTLTLDATGGIATVTGGGVGTGYIAPQITIVDMGPGRVSGPATCGAVGQPACGLRRDRYRNDRCATCSWHWSPQVCRSAAGPEGCPRHPGSYNFSGS